VKSFFTFAVATLMATSMLLADEYVPRKGFVTLQFDDGYRLHHTHIAPILEAHGMKASFGVITESSEMGVENEPWRMVELYEAGHEIQDHTTRHNYLWATHVDTVPDSVYEWIPYTFADPPTWHSLTSASLAILRDLGISTVGWNQPGGTSGTGALPGHPTWEWRGLVNFDLYNVINSRFCYMLGAGVSPWTAHVNTHGNNFPKRFPLFNVPHWNIEKMSLAEIKTSIADAVSAGIWYVAATHAKDLAEVAKIESLVEWLDTSNVEVLRCVDGWQRIYYGKPNPLENQLPQARMLHDIDGNGKPDGFLGDCVWDTTCSTPVDTCYSIKITGQTEFYCYGPELGENAFSIWLKLLSGDIGQVQIIAVEIGFDWDILEEIWTRVTIDTNWCYIDSSVSRNFIIAVDPEVDRIRFAIRPAEGDTLLACMPELMHIPNEAGLKSSDNRTLGLTLSRNILKVGEAIAVRCARPVALFDVRGRRLSRACHQGDWQSIKTSNLAPGIYFVATVDEPHLVSKVVLYR